MFPIVVGRVGLGQSADGLGWIGSHKMDPWTTLGECDPAEHGGRGQGGGGLSVTDSVEALSEERRDEIGVDLGSACCEVALSLVYSDGSTQLREIAAVSGHRELLHAFSDRKQVAAVLVARDRIAVVRIGE